MVNIRRRVEPQLARVGDRAHWHVPVLLKTRRLVVSVLLTHPRHVVLVLLDDDGTCSTTSGSESCAYRRSSQE